MANKTIDMLNHFLRIPRRPKNLSIILTHRCNLNCAYCLRDAGSNERREIPYGTLKKIIATAHRFGIRNVGITGGEAFLYSRWKELAELLGNLKWRVLWETNGRLINEKTLQFMKKCLENRVSFLVSLDSRKEKIHDELRGRGSFKKAVAAIKLIKSCGFRLETNIVLTPFNLMDEKDLVGHIKFNKKFGVDEVCLNRAVNLGRGSNQEIFKISDEEIARLEFLLKKYSRFDGYVRDGVCRKIEDDAGCERLGSEVCVSASGLHPCVFHEDIKLGKLEDFHKIFLNQNFFKTLNILRLASMAGSRGEYFGCAGCVEYLADYLGKIKKLKLAANKKVEETNDERILKNNNNLVLPSGFSVLLTQKCNLKCDFCEFECSPQKTAEIDIADFEKLLIEGRKIGVSEIALNGGEPLIYSHIKEAIYFCSRYGYDVTFVTTGWHFHNYLPEFKKYGIKKFIFGINGTTARTNDAIMGRKGAFERTVNAIKKSKELGFFTGVNFVIHPLNVKEFDQFLTLAEKWKLDYLKTLRIVEVGRAKANSGLRLTPEQIEKVRKIYWKHRKFLRRIRFYGSYIDIGRPLSCNYLALYGQSAVHWDGEIALCSMTPLLNLPFKKIRDYSLLECLAAMNSVNQKFQKDRDKEFPKWRFAENPYLSCEYCHERLAKSKRKYFAN
jgi:MoaA/NifB/PqqE/SkfB family radical SAM enzyme